MIYQFEINPLPVSFLLLANQPGDPQLPLHTKQHQARHLYIIDVIFILLFIFVILLFWKCLIKIWFKERGKEIKLIII